MHRILLFVSSLIYIIMMFSCRVSRTGTSRAELPATAIDYIERYKDVAISEMKRTGIPASITMAQGMLESGYGRSRLAIEANNHFGIKCHNGWTGPTIRHHDDRRNECFRKYRTAEESFRDHSDFLKNTPRYQFLFELDPADYKGWARGLKKAGYATNPDYAGLLIRKIEEYELYELDRMVLNGNYSGKSEKALQSVTPINRDGMITEKTRNGNNLPLSGDNYSRIMENNRIKYIIVKEGDTKESIERELNLLHWQLSRYNELPEIFSPVPGQILYIQPKRKKAAPGNEIHKVEEGDTMYSISQQYGIKVKYLYYYNRMEEGSEPELGSMLWLRRVKPVD